MDGLVSLLAHDARLVMPPYQTWYQGPAAIATFLGSRMPDSLARTHVGGHWRLLTTAANGQPAFRLYLQSADHTQDDRFGIAVLTLGADRMAAIPRFTLDPAQFNQLGLTPRAWS